MLRRFISLRRAALLSLMGTLLSRLATGAPASQFSEQVARYDVIWQSPSENASGVMPLGNGDLGAGVYAIQGGDLFLLLSKSDALNYDGDLLKTGRVRISLSPNPFLVGKPFRQTLDLAHGCIQFALDGVTIRVWADANNPVYHVEIEASQELKVSVAPDPWTRFDYCAYNVNDYLYRRTGLLADRQPPQDVLQERENALLWYYGVGDRSVFADDLDFYGVREMASRMEDPYRFNTFGNLIEANGLRVDTGRLTGKGYHFDIRIHALTQKAPKPERWIDSITELAARPIDLPQDWAAHCAWWAHFWNRSWITASDRTVPADDRERLRGEASVGGVREERDGAALVAQGYNVYRFLMACQSRGRLMTKFNGGLFTQQLLVPEGDTKRRSGGKTRIRAGLLTHEDDRLWGRRFTYQNERLLYWPLLYSGDYDLMQPFFDYYSSLLPMRKAITRVQFGHIGAYFRENIEPTGAERDCGLDGRPGRDVAGTTARYYHDYYYTSGLETTAMMLDYAESTQDTRFRDTVLVPFAREILAFYSLHYPRDAGGKLHIDPGQVLETWWRAVNPAPDVAGLQYCLDRLVAMPAGTEDDQRAWREFRREIPELPIRMVEGRPALVPADLWTSPHNSENGELYAVFPFRRVGLAWGTGPLADWTIRHRTFRNAMGYSCWSQDQIDWALAGNADEAADGLVHRFRRASTQCRFPLYGTNVDDGCPDLDHFGSGSVALQRMLVQEAGNRVFLLPAWPKSWDADFKLHLSHRTTVAGTVRDGTLVAWSIDPVERSRDVVLMAPQ